ncbi:MAG TPA: hypothetical protein PKH77_22145, partial [Anaerolineae bacterium]|nr:hypothetical protein [Anaerolineae bacterium]
MKNLRGNFLRAWAGPVVVMGLGLALIYRRLLAGRVLADGDLHLYFFPYWMTAARAFLAGKLPLWTPDLFAGAPLLANPQIGVFYPLNWPLWALSDGSLLGVTRALHLSVLLHLALAAVTACVLARRVGATPWGAALAGLLYAGGGYLGLHIEHLNQLQGLAWLPLVLLPGQKIQFHVSHFTFHVPFPSAASVVAFALMLLAGHTQMAFIAGVGLLVWKAVDCGSWSLGNRYAVSRGPYFLFPISYFLSLLPFALAPLIAAVQLLPTLELTQFSLRSGGLPWREAVSFSIRPWDLPETLLPTYLVTPLLPEGVAYLGLVGMALAGWGAWRGMRWRDESAWALVVLAGVGVFLALGAYNPLYLAAVRLGIPGLIHFRAPARFLALYTLGMALLAGLGFSALPELLELLFRQQIKRIQQIKTENGVRPETTTFPLIRSNPFNPLTYLIGGIVTFLVFVELLLSSAHLPHADATAARAYTDLRPAIAHLVAATQFALTSEWPGRFLSISKTLFDAGDEVDMTAIYGEALSTDALWQYKVAAKHREVLSPNLALAFGVPAVDGYDGGLLPLRHYSAFSQLMLPEGTLDGRLRENLTRIPDARWLSLLDVRFVMTDKTGDAWVEDVFYDRQFQPALDADASLSLGWLPDDFTADALGLLYAGAGNVTLTLGDGRALTATLPAQVAESPYRVRWGAAARVTGVTLQASIPGLTLTGASLLDERAGAFYPLTLSEHFRLAHSGDVKIYEALAASPRVFWTPAYTCVSDDAAALAVMRAPAFDPAARAVVQGCEGGMEAVGEG